MTASVSCLNALVDRIRYLSWAGGSRFKSQYGMVLLSAAAVHSFLYYEFCVVRKRQLYEIHVPSFLILHGHSKLNFM